MDSGAAYLASAGVNGVFAVAIFVTGIVVCVRARRNQDPARRGFTWLKAVFTFTFISFVLSTIAGIANGLTWIFHNDYSWYGSPAYDALLRVSAGTGLTSTVMIYFAELCFIMTCIEIGNGFMLALEQQQQRTSKQKLLRMAGLAVVALLFILTIAYAGVLGSAYSVIYGNYAGSVSQSVYESIQPRFKAASGITMALLVIILVVEIGLLAQSAFVAKSYRHVQPGSKTVSIYVAATVLAVVRSIYNVVYIGIVNYSKIDGATNADIQVPTDVIFNIVIWFIVLMLLFSIGIRRYNGLWSTPQPWTNAPATQNQMWYGQQQMYQQGAYPPPGTVMYQPEGTAPQQYGWAPQQYQQPQQYEQQSVSSPSEAPGVPPNVVPAGDPAHMLHSGPDMRAQGHVTHEMKA